LRYQVKTHAMPRKGKVSCNFSPFFFIIIKNCNMEITSYARQDDANTEKLSFNLLFLSSPTSTCNALSREIGGRTKLVSRLHRI
jgi:hypothetical protein